MMRFLLVASILAVVAACDKAKEMAGGGARTAAADSPALPPTNLAGRPDVLFQTFGEREDARILPIAVIVNGRIEPITLDDFGWQLLDSLYMRTGNTLTLYRNGRQAGTVTVRQGMWEREDPLYSLPGCQSLVPQASVSVQSTQDLGYTVELMASTKLIGRSAADEPPDPELADREGRRLLGIAAADANIDAAALAALQIRTTAIHLDASGRPAILATALDKEGDADAGRARVAHLFVVGEADAAGSYRITFAHAANGPASSAEYRRYIDHLDLTGDGVDEIILEGWKTQGDTYLAILGRNDGVWTEVFRGRSSWCLDSRK